MKIKTTKFYKSKFFDYNILGSNVARLCYKARVPVSEKLLSALEFQRKEPFTVAAVCVYPARIADAVATIQKMSALSYIPVAASTNQFCNHYFCVLGNLIV